MALWRAAARGSLLRGGLLCQGGAVLHQPVLVLVGPRPPARCLFSKYPVSTIEALRIWKMLESLGFRYCSIVRLRRRLKKFSYPWLSFCVPAALILAIGDFIAQYHLKPHKPDRTIGQFITKEWAKGETLLFALIGFFVLGPVLSKWNLFLYRKLRCHKSLSFLIRKLAVDLFILSPILLTVMALIYGAKYGKNIFKGYSEKTKQIITENYKPAIMDTLTFNIISRVLAAFGIFYLAPMHLRRLLKTVYEVVFAAYLTNSFRKHIWVDPAASDAPAPVAFNPPCITRDSSSKLTRTESRWAKYKKWACRNRD